MSNELYPLGSLHRLKRCPGSFAAAEPFRLSATPSTHQALSQALTIY